MAASEETKPTARRPPPGPPVACLGPEAKGLISSLDPAYQVTRESLAEIFDAGALSSLLAARARLPGPGQMVALAD